MYCVKCSTKYGQKIEMVYFKPLHVWECFGCGNQSEDDETARFEYES